MLLILSGCTTAVYHPTKSEPEMQADVSSCTDHANRKYWMDAVAALYEAYDCLDAKGYTRSNKGFAQHVEQSARQSRVNQAKIVRAKPAQPVQPCRVPCR